MESVNGHIECESLCLTSMLSRKDEWQKKKHWISRWIWWLFQWMPVHWHSVQSSASPQWPQSLQRVSWRNQLVMVAWHDELPLPKAGLATTPLLLNAWPSAVQSNAEALIWYNPSRTYIAIGCQVHYLRSLLPWRRWQLIFTRNDTYSDYGFAFKLASTIICKPQMGCFWRDQTLGSQQIKKLVFENSNKIQKVLARLDQ